MKTKIGLENWRWTNIAQTLACEKNMLLRDCDPHVVGTSYLAIKKQRENDNIEDWWAILPINWF